MFGVKGVVYQNAGLQGDTACGVEPINNTR